MECEVKQLFHFLVLHETFKTTYDPHHIGFNVGTINTQEILHQWEVIHFSVGPIRKQYTQHNRMLLAWPDANMRTRFSSPQPNINEYNEVIGHNALDFQ